MVSEQNAAQKTRVNALCTCAYFAMLHVYDTKQHQVCILPLQDTLTVGIILRACAEFMMSWGRALQVICI